MYEKADIGSFLPDFWHSFVLDDARNREAFIEETAGKLSEIGFEVNFLQLGT
jgi:hypothetical protein